MNESRHVRSTTLSMYTAGNYKPARPAMVADIMTTMARQSAEAAMELERNGITAIKIIIRR